MKKCGICQIITIVAGLGALNWLFLANFQIDFIVEIFGGMTAASKTVYTIIGLAGLALLITLLKPCPCSKK